MCTFIAPKTQIEFYTAHYHSFCLLKLLGRFIINYLRQQHNTTIHLLYSLSHSVFLQHSPSSPFTPLWYGCIHTNYTYNACFVCELSIAFMFASFSTFSIMIMFKYSNIYRHATHSHINMCRPPFSSLLLYSATRLLLIHTHPFSLVCLSRFHSQLAHFPFARK